MTDLPGLNFQLGEDIDALRDAVRDFAQTEIAPRAAEIDKNDLFPADLSGNALSRYRFKVLDRQKLDPSLLGTGNDRLGERMFAVAFEAGG